jgi:protein-L-isoaspartate(D-aspartate) O-methyltransferase
MTKDVFAQLSLDDPRRKDQARINMLKQQIRTWDVLNDKILGLFVQVPREDFVPTEYKSLAFADMSIPLGHYGQEMMTPKEEGRVLQDLHIKPEDKILVLGTDSGFLLALLSKLGKEIYHFDNDFDLDDAVKMKLAQHNIHHVITQIGNLHHGWHSIRPFDVILLTGSLPAIPDYLKEALSMKGRLFVVVGNAPSMEAMIITRITEHAWEEKKIFETVRPRMVDVKEPDTFKF